MRIIKKQEGIGLVEVIFSLGIAVIIVTSLVSLAVFTLRTSVQNKLLLRGSSLATQQLELVRAYRDSGTWTWPEFLIVMRNCDSSDERCSITGITGIHMGSKVVGSGAETVTIYFTVTGNGTGGVITGSEDYIKIAVTAHWKVGTEDKYAHNYTELSNWRE